jgi:hypothetical protein
MTRLRRYGNEARVLMTRSEPFRFNDPQFALDGDGEFVNCLDNLASNWHISHGNLHIVRVPRGKYAALFLNNEAVILNDRVNPYVFCTPWFRVETEERVLINQRAEYICHNTIHIIRVSSCLQRQRSAPDATPVARCRRARLRRSGSAKRPCCCECPPETAALCDEACVTRCWNPARAVSPARSRTCTRPRS